MQPLFLIQGIFMSDKNDEQKQKEDTKDTIPEEPSSTKIPLPNIMEMHRKQFASR